MLFERPELHRAAANVCSNATSCRASLGMLLCLLAMAISPRLVDAQDGLRFDSPAVSGRVDAELSPNINRMVLPQYYLQLEQNHSRLLIMNRRVRRIAITDSSIANYVQYAENEISMVGLELGRTDLTMWFEDDPEPVIYEVTVVRDASLEEQRTVDLGRLERRLQILYPNSLVNLIPLGSQVIVRGTAFDAQEAASILSVVSVEVARSGGGINPGDDLSNTILGGGPGLGVNGGAAANAVGTAGMMNQNNRAGGSPWVINELVIPGEYNISLRVIVAELNRSALKNFGLNWNVVFGGASLSSGGAGGLGGAGGAGGVGGAANLSGIFENGDIQLLVNWLQSNGTIRMLAEPRLTVLSGTGASILAGGEFAVPTIVGIGGGSSSSFRGFGTSLVVTPTVVDRDLIRLQVQPEFSSVNADNAVQGIPGTNVKRVQTTVELREGQTFAIGGLISSQTLVEVSSVPLLGDIPWLGPRVFQSKASSMIETELLVLVSPEIVRPMNADEVPPLPGYNVPKPTDDEIYWHARTEGAPDHTLYQLPPLGYGELRPIPQAQTQMGSQPPIFGAPGGSPGPYTGGYPGAPMQPMGYPQGSYGGMNPAYPPMVPQVAPSGSVGSAGYGATDPGFGGIRPASDTRVKKSGGLFPGFGVFSREKTRSIETVSGEGAQPTTTGWSWGQ